MSLRGLYRSTSFLSQGPMGPQSYMKDIPQDPVTLVVAAVSTASAVGAAALAGTAFTFAGYLGAQAIFASFAFNAALGYALNSLAPKANLGNASGGYGVNVNALSSNAPTQVIYGRTRVGGVVFMQDVTGTLLSQMVAFADHEIDAFEEVYFNDERVSSKSVLLGSFRVVEVTNEEGSSRFPGAIYYNERFGTLDQEYVDLSLLSLTKSDWDNDHVAAGVAYLAPRYYYDRDYFPNGVPVISSLIRGKKVYDPRTGETAFTDSSDVEIGRNPALILRDYLIYSGIAEASEIDDDAFNAAANICDEDVALDAGGTEKRYRCDGAFTTEENPQDIIKSIISTMGGMVWYSAGKWSCKAAAYTTPVLTLDEDDLRSGIQISTRRSRREGFNKVVGQFRGDETSWQVTNFPEVKSDAFVIIDGGEESTLELDLPFVSTSTQAQRIAKIALYRNREQLKISGSFGMRALQLSVGDIVKITNSRLGFVEKQFEIVEWTFGLNPEMALEVAMTLQEISAAIFDWNAEEKTFESNNTTLSNPFDVPEVGITITNESRVINQHLTNLIAVDVSSHRPDEIESVEVEYLKYNNKTVKYTDLDTSLSNGQIATVDGTWGVSQGGSLLTQVDENTSRFYVGWLSGGPTEAFLDDIRGTSSNGNVSFLANEQGNYDEFTFYSSQSGKSGSAKFDVLAIQKQQTAANGGFYIIFVDNVFSVGTLTGLSTSDNVNVFFAWEFLRTGTEAGYISLGKGDLGRYEIIDASVQNIDDPVFSRYSVRARATNSLGVRGAYTEVGRASSHDTTGPTAVSNIEKSFSDGSLHLDWTPSASGDLSHYKIHRNYETSGASFTDFHTQPVVDRVARPSSDVILAPQVGTFFIEPYDKAGNAGTVASIVVTSSDIDTRTNSASYTASGTTYDFSTASGPLSNVSIWTSGATGGKEAILTDYSSAPSEGSIESDGENNVGSNKAVRLSVTELEVQRHSADSTAHFGGSGYSDHSGNWFPNFDSLPKNIDAWPKDYNFDSFALEDANFKDVFVEVYAATRKDGSYTWLDWTRLPCTLEGRYFKYKYVLKSTSDNISPVFQKAVITLEHN